jgi:hypothetical protein
MQNKSLRVGPVAMSNAAANILNGAVTSLAGPVGITLTQPVITLRHIRIVNKTAGAVTATLYIGATGGSAAGTEFAFNGYSIPANSYAEWVGNLRLESTDFLTGLASAATSLTFQAEGEIGFQ